MYQFTVKDQEVKVDETKLSPETLKKVILKGLSRIFFERETGKEDTDARLPLAIKAVAEDPEKYYSAIRVTGPSVSMLDKELTRLLYQFAERAEKTDKKVIPATITGEKFKDRFEAFSETETFDKIFQKVKADQKWVTKAQKEVDRKMAEAAARKKAKTEAEELSL